jgi:hypothetical protein
MRPLLQAFHQFADALGNCRRQSQGLFLSLYGQFDGCHLDSILKNDKESKIVDMLFF